MWNLKYDTNAVSQGKRNENKNKFGETLVRRSLPMLGLDSGGLAHENLTALAITRANSVSSQEGTLGLQSWGVSSRDPSSLRMLRRLIPH